MCVCMYVDIHICKYICVYCEVCLRMHVVCGQEVVAISCNTYAYYLLLLSSSSTHSTRSHIRSLYTVHTYTVHPYTVHTYTVHTYTVRRALHVHSTHKHMHTNTLTCDTLDHTYISETHTIIVMYTVQCTVYCIR